VDSCVFYEFNKLSRVKEAKDKAEAKLKAEDKAKAK
jgi:hypothetical protein